MGRRTPKNFREHDFRCGNDKDTRALNRSYKDKKNSKDAFTANVKEKLETREVK